MCREYFELLKEWKFKINMSRVAQKDETLIEAKYGETHNERHTQLAIFGCKMRCSQNLLDVALATPPGGAAPHFSLEADFADCAFHYAFLNRLNQFAAELIGA